MNNFFLIRGSLSFGALILLILRYTFPNVLIDNVTFLLVIVLFFPWFIKGNLKFEIPFLGGKFEFSSAKEYVGRPKPRDKDTLIAYNTLESVVLEKKDKIINTVSLKARIHFSHEAGAGNILRLYINGVLIDDSRLREKEKIRKYIDNREAHWFDSENRTWRILYSPDFHSNYNHKKYKVVNGDPYLFVFDISDIVLKDSINLILIHEGQDKEPAHKNYIVISDIKMN